MPPTWENFKFAQGTREPSSLRVNDDNSAAVVSGYVTRAGLDDILGGVETAEAENETGRLRRTNPVAHPERASLFLRSLDNIAGVSFVEKVAADPGGVLEVPSLPYRSEYEKYHVQATFTGRPYTMLADESIPQYTISWYDSAGSPQTKTGFREYWRNTVWMRDPHAEYLTADLGLYTIANPGAAPGVLPQDEASGGRSQIRQLLPSSTWRCNWYGVPYGYVLSSNTYFDRLQGHVNQNTWEGFEPGEALLTAVTVARVYSPPFPDFVPWAGHHVVSAAKLCDLVFTFHAVRRPVTTAVSPTNPNHIANHQNCIVFGSPGMARYYYLEAFRSGSAGSGYPIYPSTNFELLFQNPDGPP